MGAMAIALIASNGVAARADELLIGQHAVHRVEIVGYEKGQLEYRAPNGAYHKVPVYEITFLTLDSISGVADFNAGEELLVKDRPAQAVERYERALRTLRGTWADLTQVRLLVAADRAGLFEKAVRATLSVAERDPVAAARLLPAALPAAPDRGTERSFERIRESLNGALPAESRQIVELLQYAMLRKLGDPRADERAAQVARLRLPAALLTPRTVEIQGDALSVLLAAARYAEVLAAVDDLLTSAPASLAPRWLLLKAEALLGSAQTDDDYLGAALVAMRVGIEYADAPVGGEGLLVAARAHEATGRTDDAVRILRECLRRDAADQRTKDAARDMLARLTQTAG